MAEDPIFIDSLQDIKNLVDLVAALQAAWAEDMQPLLFIDLEGENLSRHGTVSLLTLLISSGRGLERFYLIDIHTLGRAAFYTRGKDNKTLKDILESSRIPKVFFDVRNDSDALYSHYGVELHYIWDIQLMESATRPNTKSRKYLSGLSKCIITALNNQEGKQWKLSKEKGDSLWNPDKGGSYKVFDTRPLPKEIESYCIGDVQYLPRLYHKYRRDTKGWSDLIVEESQKRVSESQGSRYIPKGAWKALSPWSPEQNKMLDSWNREFEKSIWDSEMGVDVDKLLQIFQYGMDL